MIAVDPAPRKGIRAYPARLPARRRRGIVDGMPPPAHAEKLRIGTAGFSYPDWRGVFYPRGAPSLAYYARFFDTIEIDRTFYGPARPQEAAGWLEAVKARPGFLFTAKVWQVFTHERPAPAGETELAQYLDGIAPLAEAGRLGALLLQFPHFFVASPKNQERLARLVDVFARFPLVVEVRDISWTKGRPLRELERLGVSLAAIDQPQGKRTIPPTAAFAVGRLGYVRLHGRNAAAWFTKGAPRDAKYDYLYDAGELGEWKERIESLAAHADRVFVIANNHFRGKAPANALELAGLLAGERVPAPACLVEAYPEIARHVTAVSENAQQELFS